MTRVRFGMPTLMRVGMHFKWLACCGAKVVSVSTVGGNALAHCRLSSLRILEPRHQEIPGDRRKM
jgi:hypothetical protein